MDRGAVIFDDSDEHRRLLREAARTAAGHDAELLVVTFVTPDELEADIETLESIGKAEGVDYSDRTLIEGIASSTRETVAPTLDELSVEYSVEVIEVVDDGQRSREIVELGDTEGVDHVFMLGRKRTPTGKAVFGDTAQSVILNFDGYVTIATR